MELASKRDCRSEGVVCEREGGPRSPEEQIQTSRRPKEERISSIRESVEGSLAVGSG